MELKHLARFLQLAEDTIGGVVLQDENEYSEAELQEIDRALGTIPESMFEDFVLGDYEEHETFAMTMFINWANVPITKELIFLDKFLNKFFGSQEKEGYYK